MTVPDRAPATGAKTGKERPPLWLDPGFQLRAFLPLLVFAVVYAVLLYVLLFLPLDRNVADEVDLGVRAILRGQIGEIHLRVWPLLGVAGLLAAYVSFYQALHTVRPVYRLHETLKELAAGEYRSLRLEPGEAFRFFEDDVGQLSQKMKLIAARNRDILFSVNAHVTKLASRLAADEVIPRADLEEVVASLRAQLEKAPEIGIAGRH